MNGKTMSAEEIRCGCGSGSSDDETRVLTVASSVVWGHVGNESAVFPLQVCLSVCVFVYGNGITICKSLNGTHFLPLCPGLML